MPKRGATLIGLIWLNLIAPAFAASPPLVLDATIPLPDTSGRIDHLDIDLARQRLFVAELGNGTVDVIDLASARAVHRIAGLAEPQGIVYVPGSDLLAVASGGDGTLRLFDGSDYTPRGIVKLGDDADNARLDPGNGTVIVGHGSGGLAIVNPNSLVKLTDISLPAHPEAFQISGSRVFVNVPDAGLIEVADLVSGKPVATWHPPHLAANYPMALGEHGVVAVVFRSPARLALFEPSTGEMTAIADTCGDADDVFLDATRQRYYVTCGAGAIDVFQTTGRDLRPLGRIPTVSGARTSLFVPTLDRLFVASRASLLGTTASIRVYRPLE